MASIPASTALPRSAKQAN